MSTQDTKQTKGGDIMQLPEGYTCAQCYAFDFCHGIGCTEAENTRCDYSPSRFSPSAKVLQQLRPLLQIPPLPV